jgi:hypothetical protein
LFGDGVSPGKKMTETASLRVTHDAKFPSFFFSGDSSITKQNKQIHSLPFNHIKKTQILCNKTLHVP